MKTLIAMLLIMGFSAHANKNAVCPHMEGKRLMANTNPQPTVKAAKEVANKSSIRNKGIR